MAKAKDSEATEALKGPWRPPEHVQELELAEFYKFKTPGQTLIGKILNVTERPDPQHPGSIMQALVLAPAVTVDVDGDRNAYASLAVGLSAHLQLLLQNPRQEIGNAYAITYEGQRAATERGKNPSHQFKVFKLSEADFRRELEAVGDDLPF